jgi:cytochrome c-type biogenesis protein CcmE
VPVEFTGVLPDLFGEGEGMVGTGSYVNGVFQATEILAKHDETYMPKEVVDALKEQGVYKDPEG